MRIYTSLPEEIVEKGITFKRNPDLKTVNDILDGRKYRIVQVLAKNLRGKLNIHGKPYEPSKWIYIEV